MNKLKKFVVTLVLLALAAGIPGQASAEMIDDVVLGTEKGKVVVTIKLAGPVQYLRHFPRKQGQMLEIYYNILADTGSRDQWQDYETHKSPPSTAIPGFTVTTRDQNTQPRLVIQFVRPVEFSVRGGKNNRSIVIIIQPEKFPDGLPELPEIEPEGLDSGGVPASADAATASQAKALMIKGRDALLFFDFAAATQVFDELLRLPSNKYTQESQEWLGVAYEGANQPEQAKASYEQYLKRYARGAGVARVKERLARLPAIQPVQAAEAARPAVQAPVAAVVPAPALTPPLAAEPKESAARKPEPIKAVDTTPLPPVLVVPVPGVIQPAVDAPALPSSQVEETNKQAGALMAKGQEALQSNDYGVAIASFNKLLLLPPNKYTQDAQEWVGVARERAGQKFKAKLEYESYLKSYTSGEGVARVKGRLAKLSGAQPEQVAAKPESPKERTGTQTVKYGSLSVYYYHGASRTDTTTVVGGVTTPSTLTLVDQSLLLTSVNMGVRSRSNEYDNRLVFQDTFSKNFIAGQASSNKLSAAYFDFKNKVHNYSGRIGRQAPVGGGILGRFDGAVAGYGFLPKWHANVVGGRLVDFSAGSKPVFYGASLDMGTFNESWGGSLYLINQKIDGISDRKAVGADMRYFDSGKNVFATLDYDTSFSVVNMALLQGTVQGGNGTSYNFLVDHRKTPSISTRNALNGAATPSVNTLLQAGWTVAGLKELAKLRTATANLAQVGASRQIKENWMLGSDIKVSNITGMPASGADPLLEGVVAATPGTGTEWALTAQLIGSSLFSSSDVSVLSVSASTSQLIKGQSLLVSNHSVLREKWMVDASLRLYRQNDNLGGKQTITTPMLKVSYQAKDRLSLEAEGGFEITGTTPANAPYAKTTRKFFSLGMRGDF
ncbi:MAG: hypothetical protein HY846_09670 [Nitrosomonadales bacterium]|nr:hypothetical protein [Nitrosomonadales bacterium]